MIRTILFDSGRVLNRPVSGSWFIPPNFFKYVDRKRFYAVPVLKRKWAFKKAGDYINKQNLILNEKDEYICFVKYYSIFSTNIPELKMGNKEIGAAAQDLVYYYNKYSFYDDAVNLIPKLSEKYKLAVVSDAWPSLESVFKTAGFRKYFSSFVISSVHGVTKPNKIMYNTALHELGVLPGEAVFIDDNVKNCAGAKELGLQSIVLCRSFSMYMYNKLFCRNYRIIRNLNGLERYIV
ncbi:MULTISPECIES: HAD-IA family hydrolase [Clostridium]|uniref:HAD-IA family hydrolase n=1 Tax=Clostridium TaxID=1485 RepID=UPI0008265B41|nr:MULTISPECIES: HAD-IA family hydrolase [Clostridium]PJI07888.1 HAD family hydrolase [Clostridium sp. CT7]